MEGKSKMEQLKKAVIYVDTEDDITSLVAKIKKSSGELVELVPPKRAGFLQSSVSMKLIKRTAKKAEKEVAIVTTDENLLNLAAAVGILVAKNLRATPEMPALPKAEQATDDLIDGEDLQVKKYTPKKTAEDEDVEVALRKLQNDQEPKEDSTPTKPAKKAPNFNRFRQKLFLIGGGVLVLLGFLIWAIFWAPKATITIYAKTSSEKIQSDVTLGPNLATNSDAATLKSVQKTERKEATADGLATGTRDDGTFASGASTLTCNTGGISPSCNVPNNVTFNGKTYTVSSGGSTISDGSSANVTLTAPQKGEQYNAGGGTFTVNTALSGSTSGISGGSSKQVKVVTSSDISIAREKIQAEDEEKVKQDLLAQLRGDYTVIDSSFKAEVGDAVATPELDQATAGDGKFTVKVVTTYSVVAVAKSELKDFVSKILDAKADSLGKQKVYDYGVDNVTVSAFNQTGDKATAMIYATGKIGPNIDAEKLVGEMGGKKTMEVNSELNRVNGVTDVQTTLWPFWVTKVPKNAKKVEIKFVSEN